MTRSLEHRVERLERDTHVGDADIGRARAICHAYEMVRHHPEEARADDRALAAATSNEDWQRAFSTLIDAAGGVLSENHIRE
jgi:thiamine biosynthesis protein ThiC